MAQLESWKVPDLRRLAGDFRRRAGETTSPRYVDLMLFTAEQLDTEADRLEREAGLGRHLSILA